MPRLSHEDALRFWEGYTDPMVYRVIIAMEAVEDWTLDGDPELEAAIDKLGAAMEDIGNVELKNEDDFIRLTAYLKISRALYMLQVMDTAYPGAASKLLTYAEQNNTESGSAIDLFLQRNISFERLRLLGRIFSNERLAMIQKAMEDDHHA